MLQTRYQPNHKWTLTARYRLRLSQQDYKESDNAKALLADKNEHRARLSAAYQSGAWSTKTQIDAAYTSVAPPHSEPTESKGWMIAQTAAMRMGIFTLAANVGYFHTDDYQSRLYTYERSTLYNFSFPVFFGEGMRGAVLLRVDITPNLTVIGKAGTTKYFDRDHISSSLQQIDKSHKTDIDLQVKWKF